MIDLLLAYECPNCGEILEDQVHYHKEIDTENDEVYHVTTCSRCTCTVFPKFIDGQACYQHVDHERWLQASEDWDEL